MASLQSEVNRLLNTFFDSPASGAADGPMRRWAPAMDLVEGEDHYVLKADLPGMDEGDVRIELEDDTLAISGERKAEHADAKDGYVRVERAFGAFHRSLTLPRGVDPEQITASFDKGVLEVRIPKPQESRPRRVAIRVGEGPDAIEGTSGSDAS
jgi:HSP20 family protein